jgi:hypothetical protein
MLCFKATNIHYADKNLLLKFIIDVYICKIAFHVSLCLYNYYIIS